MSITVHLRRPAIALAAAACALALSLAAASAAQAQVNSGGPHYDFPWGDCSVNLGNVAWPGGAAVGGADVTCAHYHDFISAHVYLYRWNGTRWVDVRGGDGTNYDNYRLSVRTAPPYCGGGKAYWDDVVSVNVDGSTAQFDLDNALGYAPQYSPGHVAGC
jgi:hypothetical protein